MVSFGYTRNSNISDLRIVEAKIISNNSSVYMGVIAGNTAGGSIVDCITSGEVIGITNDGRIGGLIGIAKNAEGKGTIIKNCGSNTNIYGGYETRRNLGRGQ